MIPLIQNAFSDPMPLLLSVFPNINVLSEPPHPGIPAAAWFNHIYASHALVFELISQYFAGLRLKMPGGLSSPTLLDLMLRYFEHSTNMNSHPTVVSPSSLKSTVKLSLSLPEAEAQLVTAIRQALQSAGGTMNLTNIGLALPAILGERSAALMKILEQKFQGLQVSILNLVF